MAARDSSRGAPRTPHALLAGGGSGGHVFPALAVGDALVERGWQVSFAGRHNGMEARLAAAAGVDFYPLAARPWVGRGAFGKAMALVTLASSALSARQLVRRLGADVTLGTGGFASMPAVLGCRLAGRPAVLVEPNAEAGTANRLLSRWANRAMLAFPETASQLRCRTRVTGVPVRPDFFALPAVSTQSASQPRLLILGGSQGALQLNREVPGAVAQLRQQVPQLTVLHQCGRDHVEATHRAYDQAGLGEGIGTGTGTGKTIEITPFLNDVAAAMSRCQLIVSRAGAITTAEICAAGRAALFVPLAIAGGHQEVNARAVVKGGAARMVLSAELTGERLTATLSELLDDPAILTTMGAAARKLARPDAVDAIADEVEALAKGTRRNGRGGARA